MNWASNYVGKRFKDCWDLVRQIYGTEMGVVLPDHASGMVLNVLEIVKKGAAVVDSGIWRRIPAPLDLCVVALSRSTLIHHVGVFTEQDGGRIIHAEVDHPAVAQSVPQMKRHGYKRIDFYVLD